MFDRKLCVFVVPGFLCAPVRHARLRLVDLAAPQAMRRSAGNARRWGSVWPCKVADHHRARVARNHSSIATEAHAGEIGTRVHQHQHGGPAVSGDLPAAKESFGVAVYANPCAARIARRPIILHRVRAKNVTWLPSPARTPTGPLPWIRLG